MPILRRGITGFDANSSVDFAGFKRAVYAAAQNTGASVRHFTPGDGTTPNFHRADVQLGDRVLSIICNQTFPVVAFVEGTIAMGDFHLVDVAELAEPIANLGFEIATVAELDRPIVENDLKVLGENERDQAKYWNAKRISQLIFNWWD
jgi:hypothetical protein